jgi:hypothetical protein
MTLRSDLEWDPNPGKVGESKLARGIFTNACLLGFAPLWRATNTPARVQPYAMLLTRRSAWGRSLRTIAAVTASRFVASHQ